MKTKNNQPVTSLGTSHCFALNGNMFDPECDGLEGVKEAYLNARKNVHFYGPTHFQKILENANGMA
jgi:hypothetical protein